MAERFNLTAQIQLQAPTNTRQVIGQIRNQLQGITANVNVQANQKAINQANQGLQSTAKNARAAAASVGTLNKNLSDAARRFGVITLATGTMLSFAQAVKRAVGEAIAFERELVKISQVTGKSAKELTGLTQEITRLATGLGVSSSKLLETSRVLAQAGFSAADTKKALDILAKTTLGPTFDDITQTVEGSIAVLRQFSDEAARSGGNIKFLESTLDSINAVSKSFAVESSDLISVIRRVGGVFASAGGEVNELIALFTSVRATTRESAETISTGLRTIFTRIQRTDTVNQLEGLGIALRDAEGNFVGPLEAVKRLSAGLAGLDPRNYRFSEIVEQLGGFRQIGKVIPLIQQFAIAQDALNVAQGASGSVAADAITAQQSLAVQAFKVREEFAALIRQFSDSSTFKSVASGALELARALIRIGEALEPVLPLLTSLLALKIGQGLAPGLAALVGVKRKSHGGIIHRAAGGYVPGTGNRDTVPAMLTPGEFVIKKSSAAKLGPSTLNAMNNNKFKDGGIQEKLKGGLDRSFGINQNAVAVALKAAGDKDPADKELDIGGLFLQPEGVTKDVTAKFDSRQLVVAARAGLGGGKSLSDAAAQKLIGLGKGLSVKIQSGSLSSSVSEGYKSGIANSLAGFSSQFASSSLGGSPSFDQSKFKKRLASVNIEQIEGGIFESFIAGLSSAPFDNNRINPNETFDFPNGIGSSSSLFGLPGNLIADAKRSFTDESLTSLSKKGATLLSEGFRSTIAQSLIAGSVGGDKKELEKREKAAAVAGRTSAKRRASGGRADTVPALLTPGEFVINKSSAQSIGYSNLSKMNQTGVARFNTGGPVGIQRFQNGGAAVAGSVLNPVGGDDAAQAYVSAVKEATKQAYDIIRANQPTVPAVDALNLARADIQDNYIKVSTGLVKAAQADKSGAREALEKAQRAQVNGITKAIRAQNQNIPILQAKIQAEKQVTQAYGTFYKDLPKAQTSLQKFTNNIKKTFPTLTKIATSAPGAVGAVRGAAASPQAQGFVQRTDQIAGAAQQFAFLGGAAAALASQFGGLSEETSSAITETAGFVSSIVGIGGTVTQMITSFLGNAAASTTSAVADNAEAVASGAAAASGAMVATTFGLIAIAIVAAIAAIKFFAAKAEASAKKFDKLADQQLEGIKSGEAGATGQEFARLQNQAIVKRTEAQTMGDTMTSGEAIGGALAGAGIGAMIGSFILPGIGTAVGAAIGAGLGYFGGALMDYGQNIEEAQAAQAALTARVRATQEALVGSIRSQQLFSQALDDIDKANLKPEEAVSRRVEAQDQGAGVDFRSAQTATETLRRLAREAGKSMAELTEADFKDNAAELTMFKNATAAASVAADGMARRVNETRKTLAQAAELELTGDRDIGDILSDPSSNLAKALAQSELAIRQEAAARIARIQSQIRYEKDDKIRAQLQKDLNAEQERTNTRIKDQRNALEDQNEAARKNKEAMERAAAAQEQYRQELLKISAFTNELVNAEEALKRTEQSLGNLSSFLDGGAMDFSRQAPAGLDDLSQVGTDRKAFESQVKNIGASLGAEGKRLAEKVISTSQAIDKANRQLTNVQLDMNLQPNQFLDMLGIDPSSLGGAGAEFREAFRKAMDDGIITEEEMKKLLEPIGAGAEEAAAALKRGNEVLNQQIKQQQQFIDMLQGQRDKEIAARQKATDVFMKGAELNAQARGEELSPAQKEAGRQRSAQQALQGITDSKGSQVQAGNVDQVQDARMKADAERFKIQQQLANGDKLTLKAKADLVARERDLANTVAKTSDEMNRLTDQSGRAADIMGEIEKERSKRETMTGIVEDFVIGGDDERGNINKSFAGIQNAIQTGSFQGQSAEQRKLTAGMLDQLADIELPGMGGKTGKDIKQELVFRDAIKMGLDPRIAKQLATATSKEQQLIDAMKTLTDATYAAAEANVDFEASRTKRLETQAPPGTVVPEGGTALSSAVPLAPQEQQAEARRQKKLENIQKMGGRMADSGKSSEEVEAKAKEMGLKEEHAKALSKAHAARQAETGSTLGVIAGGETVSGGIPGAVPLDQLLSPPPPGTGIGAEAPQRFGGGIPGTQPAPGVPRDELFAKGRPQGTQTKITGIDTSSVPISPEARGRGESAERQARRNEEKYGSVAGPGGPPSNVYGGSGQQQAMAGPQAPAADPNATMQNFIGSFASVSDNIIRSFSGIQDSLSQLAQSMAGFTMTHNVTVEGLISIGGLNVEAIKTELSSSIGQVVATKVQEAMNEERKNFRS